MKKLFCILFVLSFIFLSLGCNDDDDINRLDFNCMQGTVIGRIRSSGGGLAVSLNKPYEGSVAWQGAMNVIELCNIPDEYRAIGTNIFFSSKRAEPGECGPVTADGDESIRLVLFGERFSSENCTN